MARLRVLRLRRLERGARRDGGDHRRHPGRSRRRQHLGGQQLVVVVGVEDLAGDVGEREQRQQHRHPVAVEEEGDPGEGPPRQHQDEQHVPQRRHRPPVRPQQEEPQGIERSRDREEGRPHRVPGPEAGRGRIHVAVPRVRGGRDRRVMADGTQRGEPVQPARPHRQQQGGGRLLRIAQQDPDHRRRQQRERRQDDPRQGHQQVLPPGRGRQRHRRADHRPRQQGEQRHPPVADPRRHREGLHLEPVGGVAQDHLDGDLHHPARERGEPGDEQDLPRREHEQVAQQRRGDEQRERHHPDQGEAGHDGEPPEVEILQQRHPALRPEDQGQQRQYRDDPDDPGHARHPRKP